MATTILTHDQGSVRVSAGTPVPEDRGSVAPQAVSSRQHSTLTMTGCIGMRYLRKPSSYDFTIVSDPESGTPSKWGEVR
jgi:hypothetical protein